MTFMTVALRRQLTIRYGRVGIVITLTNGKRDSANCRTTPNPRRRCRRRRFDGVKQMPMHRAAAAAALFACLTPVLQHRVLSHLWRLMPLSRRDSPELSVATPFAPVDIRPDAATVAVVVEAQDQPEPGTIQ
jgi:hypothetical protein